MVTKKDPFVSGLVIMAIAQPFGGRGALIVERHYLCGDELCVKTEPNGIGTNGGYNHPNAINWFTTVGGNSRQAERGSQRDCSPHDVTRCAFHRTNFTRRTPRS